MCEVDGLGLSFAWEKNHLRVHLMKLLQFLVSHRSSTSIMIRPSWSWRIRSWWSTLSIPLTVIILPNCRGLPGWWHRWHLSVEIFLLSHRSMTGHWRVIRLLKIPRHYRLFSHLWPSPLKPKSCPLCPIITQNFHILLLTSITHAPPSSLA